MIDDSELFHGTYDPAKAREYYLRNRQLKGRRRGTASKSVAGKGGRRPTNTLARRGAKPPSSKAKRRRAELQAQKKALEKRLDHLREVLAKRVKEAKARGAAQQPKKVEKDTAPETKVDKADRNSAEKSRKPLTSSQKSAKAKKAKETYEKEHPQSLSEDVEILQAQIVDIRKKIQKSVEDARAQKKKAGKKPAALVRSQPKPNDGPQGR